MADRLPEPDLPVLGLGRARALHGAPRVPYSYHRGSVWPVEQGTIALGMPLSGFHEHAARIARGTFEAASLFAHRRLPEVLSGHARDDAHPFPAVYPHTCWPQAWSASAVVAIVRALVGLVPSAVHHRLFVDPRLPAWLPELTLRGLRVGAARADIRFRRVADGSTTYDVLDVRGPLDVAHRHAPDAVALSTRASVEAR